MKSHDDERERAPGTQVHHGTAFSGAVVVFYADVMGDLVCGAPMRSVKTLGTRANGLAWGYHGVEYFGVGDH